MSNYHFDLSLKLYQGEVQKFSGEVQKFSGEVHDFSGEVQKFSGEVQNDLRGSAHLPTPLLKFRPWLALVQLWTTQPAPVDYIYVGVDLRRFEGLNPELGS